MTTGSYYSDRPSAEKLKRCYEIAAPRVRQYLEAEIEHVLSRITKNDIICVQNGISAFHLEITV